MGRVALHRPGVRLAAGPSEPTPTFGKRKEGAPHGRGPLVAIAPSTARRSASLVLTFPSREIGPGHPRDPARRRAATQQPAAAVSTERKEYVEQVSLLGDSHVSKDLLVFKLDNMMNKREGLDRAPQKKPAVAGELTEWVVAIVAPNSAVFVCARLIPRVTRASYGTRRKVRSPFASVLSGCERAANLAAERGRDEPHSSIVASLPMRSPL